MELAARGEMEHWLSIHRSEPCALGLGDPRQPARAWPRSARRLPLLLRGYRRPPRITAAPLERAGIPHGVAVTGGGSQPEAWGLAAAGIGGPRSPLSRAPGPRLPSKVPYRAGPTPGARVVPGLLPGRSPSSTPNLPHKSREWLGFTTRAAFAHRHPTPSVPGAFRFRLERGPAPSALRPPPTLLAAVTEPRGRSSCQSPGAPSASGWGTEEREAEGLREEGGPEQH